MILQDTAAPRTRRSHTPFRPFIRVMAAQTKNSNGILAGMNVDEGGLLELLDEDDDGDVIQLGLPSLQSPEQIPAGGRLKRD